MRQADRPFWWAAFSLGACLVLVCFSFPARAAESRQGWWASLNSQILAGQYFFNNSAGSLNGFVDADAKEGKSFSSASGFFVDQHVTYTGFKQVDELAGGGTLFQQSLDAVVDAEYIKRFDGGWSLKPHIGETTELYRETSDESWGGGLYDFYRPDLGITLERKTRLTPEIPWDYQLSYDLYYTHYPHFQALAAEFGAALAAPFPGAHVLDTVTHQFSYRNDFDLPNFETLSILYSLSLISFPQQYLVNSQDQYMNTDRSDLYQSIGAIYSKRLVDWQSPVRVRATPSLALSAASLQSNQNNFDTDPAHTQFVPGYFNYNEFHVSPSVDFLFLNSKAHLSLAYDFAYRPYSGRLAQNADGTYTGSLLYQYVDTALVQIVYPVWKNLGLELRGTWENAISNTQFEQDYDYNYTDEVYFAGVTLNF